MQALPQRFDLAPGAIIYFWHLKGGHLFGIGRLVNFLRNNQMFETLKNIKITNNNRNCNRNKLLKVQLLLKELFILAINIYMNGTVNVDEFIYGN